MKIKFKRLCDRAKLPCYAHEGDSGMDVCACEDVDLLPESFVKIKTGIAAVIPKGYEIQVRPRSGLAAHRGVVTAFGTVDSGYRGDIGVILFNHSHERMSVRVGDRIAQLVVAPVLRPDIVETDTLDDTERGTSGFGSTGVRG